MTTLALPLTAVLLLGVTPAQMGLLTAATFAPYLLVTLPTGDFIDCRRHRPILIAANLARAVLLALVLLLAVLNLVRLPLLAGLAFLTAIPTVFFRLVYRSYLSTKVGRKPGRR